MKNISDSFLALVRLGIGTSKGAIIPSDIDWTAMKALAEQQGLYAMVLDGIEKLPETSRPPIELLLEWIGEALQNYEYRYEQYGKAISELATFYNRHGFKMMVLKGYTCSLYWPKPEHRPCGDIDIWLFGKQKEADETLAREKGIKIDASHHHHTVFYWGEFMVENHYDFINVHARKANLKLEKIYKELGQDDSHFVKVEGERVFMPSPNLHALFLVRHLVSHFVGAYISVRQVLDWAFFVEKNTKEIDWEWLNGMIEKFNMKIFYSCINAICVEDFGFDAAIFKGVVFNPQWKERVLTDIITPAYGAAEPQSLIKKWAYKYRRWKGNGWKHDICYSESRWKSFWTLLWSHLMKPEV